MLVFKPWLASQEMYCGNNCELVAPINQLARGCVCRKRKDHEEDFYENDCKFSKSSDRIGDGNSMTLLIQKWANNPVVQEDSDPEVRNNDDRMEERQNDENNSDSNSGQFLKTIHKGRFFISDSECSQSLSEKHRARLPVAAPVRSKSKSKQLSRKLSVLQSKIETESQEFQKSLGYRPSLADKMKCEEISDLMQEKTKIKLELKDLSVETPRKKVVVRSPEQARDSILTSLDTLRSSAGRPYSLEKMTAEQVADERRDMQGLLGEFEKMYSSISSKKEKELMSDLYERFRWAKRLCRRQSSELVPIPEHHSLDLSLASLASSPSRRKLSGGEEEEEEAASRSRNSHAEADLEKYHQMSLAELNSTLKKLKESKKDFKRNISEIEIGVKYDEDELSMTEVYVEYKETKCKIKLIKALLDKHSI